MALTQDDIARMARLRKRNPKMKMLRHLFLLIVAAFLLATTALNFRLAAQYGSFEDRKLSQVVRSWFSDVDMHTKYSGVYIKAMERVGNAFWSLSSLMLIFLVYLLSQRQQKLLLTLVDALFEAEQHRNALHEAEADKTDKQ